MNRWAEPDCFRRAEGVRLVNCVRLRHRREG